VLRAATIDELALLVASLGDFEQDLSAFRHDLHIVLDAIEHEIATRAAADVG